VGSTAAPRARALWLGRRPYEPIHQLQQRLVELRTAGAAGDTVLLVEHEPVVTLGRNAAEGNVLASPESLADAGIALAHTWRGGDVTYHGPGQLVCYPILDLKPDRCDVRRYVRALGEAMIRISAELGVAAGMVEGMVGVWADAEAPGCWRGAEHASSLIKIGAIGVRLVNWVSMHGFALNLCVDLSAYRWIVPCGIRQHPVGSVASLTGAQPVVAEVALGAAPVLAQTLGLELERVEDLSNEVDLAASVLAA
jgi:lipoyl(octanoyl) transferase